MSENPWQTLGSRLVYDNPWIRVREDAVVRPDGEPGTYGVVGFKNRAVGVVPLFEDGTTLLVGQFRYTLGRYSWEIPEGGAPLGEALEDAALRELAEETGCTAAALVPLGPLTLSNSVTDEVGAVFLATGLTLGEARPEPTEKLEVRRLPLAEAVAMAVSGEIDDALAVVGLLRAWAHLRGGAAAAERNDR